MMGRQARIRRAWLVCAFVALLLPLMPTSRAWASHSEGRGAHAPATTMHGAPMHRVRPLADTDTARPRSKGTLRGWSHPAVVEAYHDAAWTTGVVLVGAAVLAGTAGAALLGSPWGLLFAVPVLGAVPAWSDLAGTIAGGALIVQRTSWSHLFSLGWPTRPARCAGENETPRDWLAQPNAWLGGFYGAVFTGVSAAVISGMVQRQRPWDAPRVVAEVALPAAAGLVLGFGAGLGAVAVSRAWAPRCTDPEAHGSKKRRAHTPGRSRRHEERRGPKSGWESHAKQRRFGWDVQVGGAACAPWF